MRFLFPFDLQISKQFYTYDNVIHKTHTRKTRNTNGIKTHKNTNKMHKKTFQIEVMHVTR